MFTGIVQTKGIIREAKTESFGRRLVIQYTPGTLQPTPKHGDSVSVNGCCLTQTLTDDHPGHLVFDVIGETLQKTTLGNFKPGDEVNLEPAVTASTPMGGHFVQGHIDATAQVTNIQTNPEDWRIRIAVNDDIWAYITPKGSICLEGVSLTIASCDPDTKSFEVALIPTTLDITTLGKLNVGDKVNIEGDMIAKSVAHFLQHQFGNPENLKNIIAKFNQ